MADANDWNAAIIKEFRENDGRVGGMFAAMPQLLLHHAGDEVYSAQAEMNAGLAEYQANTRRTIPVVLEHTG